MIKTQLVEPEKKNVNWSTVHHPVLVQTNDGSIFLTMNYLTGAVRPHDIYEYERNAICVYSCSSSWAYGETIKNLNLKHCELYTGIIQLKN